MKEKHRITLPERFMRRVEKELTPNQLKYTNILERLKGEEFLKQLVTPLTISRIKEWLESLYILRYCTDIRVQEYRANTAARLLGYENLEYDEKKNHRN